MQFGDLRTPAGMVASEPRRSELVANPPQPAWRTEYDKESATEVTVRPKGRFSAGRLRESDSPRGQGPPMRRQAPETVGIR
jgi:hypothetical protein